MRPLKSLAWKPAAALLALLAISNSACLSKASKPNLPQIFPARKSANQAGKPPLIIIPGILGTELVNQKTGERLWPELFPKDRAALYLPIASPNFAENRDDVVAVRVIESAQLVTFLPELGVYGAPNAGSMDAFRSVLRGYSVTEANKPQLRLFRALGRAMIFTVPSVYQIFPRNEAARFLDAELKPVAVDLFDAETWKRYGWSALFDPGFRADEQRSFVRKLGEAAGKAAFEKLATDRANYLRAVLQRAAAFHRALDAESAPPADLRLHLVGGDCEPTLAGALLVDVRGQSRTHFYPRDIPRGLRKRALDLLFIPGDGRVTRHSLFGLALHPETNETTARAMKLSPTQTLFGCEAHGDLPINPTMMNNLLTLLLGNGY